MDGQRNTGIAMRNTRPMASRHFCTVVWLKNQSRVNEKWPVAWGSHNELPSHNDSSKDTRLLILGRKVSWYIYLNGIHLRAEHLEELENENNLEQGIPVFKSSPLSSQETIEDVVLGTGIINDWRNILSLDTTNQ